MSWIKNNEWLKPDTDHRIRWRELSRFVANYRPYRARLAAAGALAFLGSATAFLIPMIFRKVQTAIVARDVSLLLVALFGFLAISLLEIATTFGIRIVNSRVSSLLNRRLVLQYYSKILNLAVEEFIAFRRQSNIFQRLIDAMSITVQFTNILLRGGQLLIVILIMAAVIGTLSPVVLAVLALGSAVLFVHVAAQARRLGTLRQRALAVNYPLVGKMTEIIHGLFTIKALAASVQVTSDVKKLVDEKTEADYLELEGGVRSDQIAQALRTVTLVAAIGVSFTLMMSGRLALADVFSLFLLTQLLLQPVAEFALLYQLVSKLSVNVRKFYEVLDLRDEVEEARIALAARRNNGKALVLPPGLATGTARAAKSGGNGSHTPPELPEPADQPGHIVLRDLAFTYRDGKEVLSGVDLEIRPGEKISLIGRSGVGKTTLIRLLLGFLQPQRGTILVDGVDVTNLMDKNVYRRQFGVVSQQDFLFGTSLRENLTFGLDEEVADERIEEALRSVLLWDGIRDLGEGLETSYSEDLFSGGQQQRLFIARALLRRPKIVLLDEPTSALDFESEDHVMKAIDRLVGDHTTITIAHRLSTVRNADRVVVLHEGQVRAVGTHEELYESDDYYRDLCNYNSFVM